MAALVNPKSLDNDIFVHMSPEQKELICIYAMNLISGKNEPYLNDKSKDLVQ